jgi:hypothetical protein
MTAADLYGVLRICGKSSHFAFSKNGKSLKAYCQCKDQDALHAGTCHGEERGEQKFVKRWTWCRLILCILMALSTRSSIDVWLRRAKTLSIFVTFPRLHVWFRREFPVAWHG